MVEEGVVVEVGYWVVGGELADEDGDVEEVEGVVGVEVGEVVCGGDGEGGHEGDGVVVCGCSDDELVIAGVCVVLGEGGEGDVVDSGGDELGEAWCEVGWVELEGEGCGEGEGLLLVVFEVDAEFGCGAWVVDEDSGGLGDGGLDGVGEVCD